MIIYYDNITMRCCIANLYKEVKIMGGTWDSDYAFIYEFIEILERLFQMFANLLSGFSTGSGDADANA